MHSARSSDPQAQPLRLLAILAHPDDEALALGGTLARYSAEGVATYLITATRGERGWQGDPADDPGPAALGELREQELRAAAAVLGVREVTLLGYPDGGLAEVHWREATAAIARQIRRIRPQVVVTFGPDGATGHPDHIAINQLTAAAIMRAADSAFAPAADYAPHQVDKLYYIADSRERTAAYDAAFGSAAMTVEGVARRAPGWEPWAITALVDAQQYALQAARAIACHRSQLLDSGELDRLTDEQHRLLWGTQEYYRVFSLVNGGRAREQDLFTGLRAEALAVGQEPRP